MTKRNLNIVICQKCNKKFNLKKFTDIDKKIWGGEITQPISVYRRSRIRQENQYKKDGEWVFKKGEYNKICSVFYCPNCKKVCRYNRRDAKSKYLMAKWRDEYLPAHRIVWLRHYGTSVDFFNKSIHHRNRIKEDNRIENLELLDPSEHSQTHRIDVILRKHIKDVGI